MSKDFIIDRAELRLFRIAPPIPLEDATHRVNRVEIMLLEIGFGGEKALGFSYTAGVGATGVCALLQDYCLPLLLGRDVRMVNDCWSAMFEHLYRTGLGAQTTLALAAMDTALWDARAKVMDQTLAMALGGARTQIPAYWSSIDISSSPGALFKIFKAKKDEGYAAFKLKVGRPQLHEDVARISAVREAIGSESRLAVDANMGWDLDESLRRVNAFDDFDLAWLEEPLPAHDVSGHVELRRKSGIPIAVGESLYGLHEFQNYLASGAVDIVQPDVARIGGLTPWLKVAHLASGYERKVAPHYMAEMSGHALCAIDNALILENVSGASFNELGLCADPLAISNGTMHIGEAPGHGIGVTLTDVLLRDEVPIRGNDLTDIKSHH